MIATASSLSPVCDGKLEQTFVGLIDTESQWCAGRRVRRIRRGGVFFGVKFIADGGETMVGW